MKRALIRSLFIYTVILLLLSGGYDIMSVQAQVVPVELTTPVLPMPVKANGQIHLAYELHITNFYVRDLTLDRIDVFAQENGTAPLATYQGAELLDLLYRRGPENLADKRAIGGGMRAVVYLWLTVKADAPVPGSLRHRLYFKFINAAGKNDEEVLDGAQIKVRKDLPIAVAAPLRGANWMAANGPSNTSMHRRRLLAFNGRVTISQRFACDFMKLGEDGKAVRGDPSKNENWLGYGAEVLAVADGVVADVQDGDPENIPLSSKRAAPVTPRIFHGNYVVLDLGNSHFAFYAHLQPQSIRVKIGDRVRRGQVIGLVGNSGNSDAPHLHFHISDGKSPVEAEGLPFVFESFEVLGEAKLSEALGLEAVTKGWKARPDAAPRKQEKEMPLENSVVRFP